MFEEIGGPCLVLSFNSGSFYRSQMSPPPTPCPEQGTERREAHTDTQSGVLDKGCQRGEPRLLMATLPSTGNISLNNTDTHFGA